jgi:hypothetical protein
MARSTRAVRRSRLKEDVGYQERARVTAERKAAFRGFGLELAQVLRTVMWARQ